MYACHLHIHLFLTSSIEKDYISLLYATTTQYLEQLVY